MDVQGLTSYFTTPKGEEDTRLLFDGAKSGLNDCIWDPSFSLPSIASLLTAMERGTWMADIDVGKQFYNFLLDSKVHPYCVVDLSPYFPDCCSWKEWYRCVMGLKSSPCGCIQMDLLGDEMAKGNYCSPANPFHFNTVCLNLPGFIFI